MEASLWKRLRYHEQGAKSNSKGKEEGTLKKGTNDPIKMIARKGVLKWDQYGKFEGPLGWTVMEDPIPHWKNLKGTNDLTVAKLDLESLRGCLDKKILSLNFRHSISITHHSLLNFSHPFGIITQFPLFNIFHIVCGPYTCHSATFCFCFLFFCFFVFFFFQYPDHWINERRKEKKKFKSPEPSEKKRKRKPKSPNLVTEEEEKKKGRTPGRPNPREERKKKKEKKGGRTPRRPNPGEEREGKKKKRKGVAELWLVGPSCV